MNEEFFAQKNIKKLRETFKTNTPFPHLVLEGLFSPKLLELMHSDFDNPKWNDWTHYDNTNERKLAVQSQLVLLGIDAEELWLLGPDSADVLVGREAAQDLQSLGEVVCRDECREMRPELRVALVVIPFDGRFLEGSVHAFDLTVRPRMIGFGQAMFDAVLLTCHVEHMRPKARSRTGSVVGQVGELDAIVGQDRGDLVRRDIDQRAQEGGRSLPIGFADQLGMSEFGCPVDGHKKIEFSFLGSDLGDVEMEEADRVDLEPASLGLVTFDIGQPADRMALQAAMQGWYMG